jgi:hypothetical protein
MTTQHIELFVVWKSMIQFCSLVEIKVTANDNNHESDMNDTNMYQISF